MTLIPDRAKDRPIYNGLLVPYSVKWFDGVPDFKIVDEEALVKCIKLRRCGLCGKRMAHRMVFIGGEMSIINKMFTDPPMHDECARYAYSVCPFLNGKITEMASDDRIKESERIRVNQAVSTIRPKRFGLLACDGYELATYGGEVYMHPTIGTVEWI